MPKLIRIMIQVPGELKEQLDSLKERGYMTSGFIRTRLDHELRTPDIQPPRNHAGHLRRGRR